MIDLEQKIRERAYQIWEQEGRVDGRAELHWQMAKLELTAAEASPAATIETVTSVEPARKTRRPAKATVEAPVAAPAPRRRRAAATLQ